MQSFLGTALIVEWKNVYLQTRDPSQKQILEGPFTFQVILRFVVYSEHLKSGKRQNLDAREFNIRTVFSIRNLIAQKLDASPDCFFLLSKTTFLNVIKSHG